MAKTETKTEEKAEVVTGGAKPPEVANGGDSRSIMIEVETASGSKKMKRSDYIRQRWAEKASRSQIAKELTELQGKAVPYQVVFAATKGIAGGPDKPEPAPAGEAAESSANEPATPST